MTGGVKDTVLIVDDTPENIDILKGILSSAYRVKVATSGVLALRIAAADPPGLILLDVMMPEVDGYEVCRRLKADRSTRDIPVIFVTACADVAAETRGFALGAEDYITKPVSPPVVLARVRTHLALKDRARHLESLVQERTAGLTARTRELEETRMEIVRCLGRAGEIRDNETGLHLIRLSHYAKLMGQQVGMTEVEAEHLMYASMLHDIGKIGIPDHILMKPGKLTAEEFEVVKTHCQIGAKIIGDHPADMLLQARDIALTHHEHWDGRGYPLGLQEEAIPLAGRIAAICDVFDALTSERPYKKAWSPEDALAHIRKESGSHFDPSLVPLFAALWQDLEAVRSAFLDPEISVAMP